MQNFDRPKDPEKWMRLALEEANLALEHDDVPIGAVIVQSEKVLSKNHNKKVLLNNPLAHAETLAIKEACQQTGKLYLEGAYLFVTLEPCPMCAGALVLARLQGVYYGVEDPKMGAISSLYNLGEDSRLNHQLEIYPGTKMEECKTLLQDFFKDKR